MGTGHRGDWQAWVGLGGYFELFQIHELVELRKRGIGGLSAEMLQIFQNGQITVPIERVDMAELQIAYEWMDGVELVECIWLRYEQSSPTSIVLILI